ncbi:stabilin-1-like [Mercenaria mercenaria]|uniref:stabilin-1-like n=1 Tax=Mercenaria mercenaria TaxID=6596 RepID=UPI00234FA7BD|nr:stabilin-1-like [Mercenaria mercenaria]
MFGHCVYHNTRGNAALFKKCADNAACTAAGGDPNAVCSMDTNAGGDVDKNCICTGAFKNNGNDDGCDAKGLSDTCDADSGCAGVTNAECTAGQCSCAAGYKGDGTSCVKVLDVACNDDADCSAQVPNSECSSSTCSCITNYKEENNICVKGCTVANECTGTDANSDCTATSCSCIAGYKLKSSSCTKGK